MKSYLRVAAVTAAVQELLLPAIHAVVSDGLVRTGTPFDGTRQRQFQGVNVFLFQVERNPALANQDLPTRSADGGLIQVPVAAIDLHYLFSFYGDETTLVPQQLLGAVVSWVHSFPVLDTADLTRIAEQSPEGLVATSGLADQIERVTLAFLPLGIEEIMRLWMVFQVPYALTVACRASVVLLESLDPPPPPKVVRRIQVVVAPMPLPTVATPDTQIEIDDVLEVDVTGAEISTVVIAVGGVPVQPNKVAARTAWITLTADLAARAGLHAGPGTLSLLRPEGGPLAETSFTLRPAVRRVSRQSQNGPGLARPGQPRSFNLTAVVAPPVAEGETVGLMLVRVDKKGPAPPAPGSVSRTARGEIAAVFAGVDPGIYRVDVTVSGVASHPRPAPRSGLAPDTVQVS